jgi:hypothetical protein
MSTAGRDDRTGDSRARWRARVGAGASAGTSGVPARARSAT